MLSVMTNVSLQDNKLLYHSYYSPKHPIHLVLGSFSAECCVKLWLSLLQCGKLSEIVVMSAMYLISFTYKVLLETNLFQKLVPSIP